MYDTRTFLTRKIVRTIAEKKLAPIVFYTFSLKIISKTTVIFVLIVTQKAEQILIRPKSSLAY